MTVRKIALYTLILDFRGGTYVKQVEGCSPGSAIVEFAEQINISEIPGIGTPEKQSLIEQLKDEIPTPLDGRINAWCVTALLDDSLVLINIVQTER